MSGVGTRALIVAVAVVTAAVALARPGPEIAVRVSGEGFDPPVVAVRRGETVRLRLSTDSGEHCFAVDAFRVEKRVVPGRPTEVELTPDRPGRFEYYCCVESGEAAARERGELVVSE